MRDGVEDYDALRLLQNLLKENLDRLPDALVGRARNALDIGENISASLTNYPQTVEALLARRRTVNELIVEISHATTAPLRP